jgi:hypothetical protein
MDWVVIQENTRKRGHSQLKRADCEAQSDHSDTHRHEREVHVISDTDVSDERECTFSIQRTNKEKNHPLKVSSLNPLRSKHFQQTKPSQPIHHNSSRTILVESDLSEEETLVKNQRSSSRLSQQIDTFLPKTNSKGKKPSQSHSSYCLQHPLC